MTGNKFLFAAVLLVAAFPLVLGAQEFISPKGSQSQITVEKDSAKYFMLKPGSELIFKVVGPNTIKIYGRIINPAKAGNASLMVYQGGTLVGAMLVTPKPSKDLLSHNKSLGVSVVSIQEFGISDGEQDVKIKSSAKSPETIVAVEVMVKKGAEQSIDLVPLVPLAPLVSQKKEEKPADIDLVPLVPLVAPTDTKQEKAPPAKQSSKDTKPEGQYKEIVASSAPKEKVEVPSKSISTVVETTSKPIIEKRIFQAGLNAGIIIPSQSIGGPYTDIGLSLSFFPIKTNPAFGLGLNTGYHNLQIDIKDGSGMKKYAMSSNLIPVSLTLSYSIPINNKFYADIFGGGGVSIISAELKNSTTNTSKSASSVAPSFNAGASLTFRLNKNNGISVLCGFVGGKASLDFVKDLDIGGTYFALGYNFTY